MVDIFITYNRQSKEISISFKPERRIVRVSYSSHFERERETKNADTFLRKLESTSKGSAKLGRKGNKVASEKVNKRAYQSIQEYGERLFRIMVKGHDQRNIASFDDLFGKIDKDFNLTLNLDSMTRKLPWEIARDSSWSLFEAYDVGRAVIAPNKPLEETRSSNLRRALVVGLDYTWCDDEDSWLHSEKEAELVGKRLHDKFGYSVKLLLGPEATIENVRNCLADGVDVFHFTGHGGYDRRAPPGLQGSLILYNSEDTESKDPLDNLTEGWLRWCFDKAERAPWFVFLNACESAKEIYSSHMIDEFISYGTTHIVGTMWSVYDQPSTDFVLGFYDQIAKEKTIGHAMTLTRSHFANERKNIEAATWPSFILYGNPDSDFKHAR